jgi:hypothetical protein
MELRSAPPVNPACAAPRADTINATLSLPRLFAAVRSQHFESARHAERCSIFVFLLPRDISFQEQIMTTHIDPQESADCPECRGRLEGSQIYTVTRLEDQALMAWDVGLALKICSDGRSPILIRPDQLDEMLRVNQFDPRHLDHVDPALPGIACPVDYTDDLQPILCLIDGSHRAARRRRDGLPFVAYVLTDQESQLCQQTMKVKLFRMLQGHQTGSTAPTTPIVVLDATCARCRSRREGPEIYRFERFDGKVFAWDIGLARQICSDSRSAVFVSPEDLDTILGVNSTDPSHLDHVNPRIPGIACACSSAGDQPLWVLIDGSHRGGRCRRDDLPFFTYLLTEEESRRCQERARILLPYLS